MIGRVRLLPPPLIPSNSSDGSAAFSGFPSGTDVCLVDSVHSDDSGGTVSRLCLQRRRLFSFVFRKRSAGSRRRPGIGQFSPESIITVILF